MRLLQFQDGVACGESFIDGHDPRVLPPGRLIIDVTDRPDAVVGCRYSGTPPLVPDWMFDGDPQEAPLVPATIWKARDATVDVFTPPPPAARSNKIQKTSFLAVLQPTEYAAWKLSVDPILMYGLAIFEADTSVDLDHPIIGQLVTQAVALNLLTPQRGAEIQQALAALKG